MAERLEKPNPIETADAFSLLTQIRERYPFPHHSAAIDMLHEIMRERALTLPCTPIRTLSDLDRFLEGKCDFRYFREDGYGGEATYFSQDPDGLGVFNQFGTEHDYSRVNVNNLYSSRQAVFVIIHPPSGIPYSSNGLEGFVSLTKHDFTCYSDLYGPKLWCPDPKNKKKPTLPFELITRFDSEEKSYVFGERSGIKAVTSIGRPNEQDFTVFVDRLSPPHQSPVFSNQEKSCVLVPLAKDGQTIADGWQVYALTYDPSVIPNAESLLPPSQDSPEEPSTSSHAVYVNLETGNPFIDNQRLAEATWVISTIALAVFFWATGSKDNRRESIGAACCCAPLVFPFLTGLWAVYKDLSYK